jgi:hypothetical protein
MSQVSVCNELTTFTVHCEVYFNLFIFYDRMHALLLSAANAFCVSQVRNIGVFWNRVPCSGNKMFFRCTQFLE